ncbi:MAG: hypothetical protein RJA70_647 [Pseudomonadota bacterium]
MKFAEPWWLLGASLSVVILALYIFGGVGLVRALKRFGDLDPVTSLLTGRAAGMRALKSALVVVAVAIAFIALAGPQYGRGTRMIPATNLDCVIVLDFSKSMYARDVAPNRIERAKSEVARLITDLPGARFGAVAFAGEPLSFPLTSDGGAIAQFFRQTSPNDMPIGGTAIARALEGARELLLRDPLSTKHQKVILLVTDGEDLEGDPVEVAKAANKEGVLVYVVQIGSRTPEVIPEVDETGQVRGVRRDSAGTPLTTSLSAAGEAQLSKVAEVGGGVVVQAESGQTGIPEIAARLKRMMTEELAEKVETLYADVFFYPLGLALVLLVLESFLPLAGRRRSSVDSKKALTVAIALLTLLPLGGCQRLEEKFFMRHSPVVDRAAKAIQTNDAGIATGLLTEYLSTGKCEGGTLGTPESVRGKPNASLDLGLALFRVAERFGRKFGEPASPDESPKAGELLAKRSAEVDCALRVVRIIAADEDQPIRLRAKAYYLSGNLEFLRHDYKTAVLSYDSALRLTPGGPIDAGEDLGTSAAFNRAIALRRLEEEEKKKPDPPDAGPPPPSDGGSKDQKDQDQKDQDQKDQDQKDQDQKDQDQKDQDQKDQDQKDQDQKDQDQKAPQPQPQPQASGAQPPPSLGQDDRMLELLERAPMLQHAQPSGQGRGRATMEDK